MATARNQNETPLSAYKDIAQTYVTYDDSKQTKLFNAQRSEFLTGAFYRGDHSRYALRDWLAGGIKNNFLFGLLPKAEHANFISLIDRLHKLGYQEDQDTHDTSETLQKAKDINKVGDWCIAAFLKVQAQLGSHPSEEHTKELRELKKDINNFLQEHKILKRIKKNDSTNTSAGLYIYEDLQTKQNYYNEPAYQQKENNRQIKTSNKRIAKGLAVLSGIAEAFMNYAVMHTLGLLLVTHLPFIAPLILPVAIVISVIGCITGYDIYQNAIYKTLKDLRLGRLFKQLDKKTGNYIPLSPYKKIAMGLAGLLVISAGFCLFVLTMHIMAPLAPLYVGLSCAVSIALSISCLYTSHLVEVIKNTNTSKIISNSKQYLEQTPNRQIALDALQFILTLAIVVPVAYVGYFLFRATGTNVLSNVWGWCSAATASLISNILSVTYTIAKSVFETRQIIKSTHPLFQEHKETIAAKGSTVTIQNQLPTSTRIQKEYQKNQSTRKNLRFWGVICDGLPKAGLFGQSAHIHLQWSTPACIDVGAARAAETVSTATIRRKAR